MDRNRALELLKQYLTEIPNLRKQHYDNQDYELWVSKIETVTKAGLDEDDCNKFASAYPHYFLYGDAPQSEHQERYQKEINMRETAMKEIIQKYEILGDEKEHPIIEVSPESIFRLVPPKAFISHGRESIALNKIEKYLSSLGIEALIVKEEASLDKDIPDKINFYLNQSDFAIILATGDDEYEGKLHPRQNVIHEIGLSQKTLPGRIIYLLEEGAEFPSNIRPKVWEYFTKENMEKAFCRINIELKALGILQTTKYPLKEHKS